MDRSKTLGSVGSGDVHSRVVASAEIWGAAMMHVVRTSPIAIGFGAVFGVAFAISLPGIFDYGREKYEEVRPVVTDWKISNTFVDGEDLVLSGTMHKVRDCLLIPPPIARDSNGVPHKLTTSMWSPKDASSDLQTWGPWRVVGGAGKSMKFSMVYMCGVSRPTIIAVGSYETPK